MILTVIAKPGSSRTEIRGWRDAGSIIIALKAPPVDGKANLELIQFLAKALNISKSSVVIKRGHSARIKHVQLPDNCNISALQP